LGGGAKIVGVFRVKNHDFTPKIIFLPIAEGGAKILGYFVRKITILRQTIIFFPILGGARAGCTSPPPDPPLHIWYQEHTHTTKSYRSTLRLSNSLHQHVRMEKLVENDLTYFYLRHVVIVVTAVTTISLPPVNSA
jgi:hypothetical protein